MDIEISNVRGIESASVKVDKISLIAGPNGAGKTSISIAVAAALMQHPAPLPGMKKSDAKLLLRDNQKRGRCEVISGDRKLAVNWPGGSVSCDGLATGSAVTCGLSRVPEIPAKDMPVFLSELLNSRPTLDDLRAGLPGYVNEATVQAIWTEIEDNGWDKAHTRAREKGAKLKGAWEQITGEKWGAKKAESWCPEAIDAEALPTSKDLEGKVSEAAARVEQVIAGMALSEDRRAKLQEQVQEGQQAKAQLDDAETKKADLIQRKESLEKQLEAAPRPTAQQNTLACPHCSADVVVANGGRELQVPVEIDAEENAHREQAIYELQGKLSETRHDLNNQIMAVNFVKQTVDLGIQAQAELDKKSEGEFSEQDLQGARAAMDQALHLRDELNRYHEAKRTAEKVTQAGAIADALATTGVRQQVLDRSLSDLNRRLVEFSKASAWGVVSIDPADLTVSYDLRPYPMLSASEQFRACVALQMAVAEIQEPPLVVVDAADILDRNGRNGLFRMLKTVSIPVLVTMTMNTRDDVPNLSNAGMGRSYWIEGATTVEL